MTSAKKTAHLGEIVFNIYREVGEGNLLNRSCSDRCIRNLKQHADCVQEIKYYCEADGKLHLTVHKGDKSGPVIATAILSRDPDGVTEIKFTEPGQALHLKHVHDFFHGRTTFETGRKKVHWKGHSALVEDGTGVCLAVYKAILFEGKHHKLGTLLVTEHGIEFIDIVVSSALVEQERADEPENEVQFCINDANFCRT